VILEHNADRAALRLRGMGASIQAQLVRDMAPLAQRLAARMRQEAPKFRSTLANSVTVHQEEPLVVLVSPKVDYAALVNRGRKPGKGLPRFFDPASASIVAWLQGNLGATGSAGPLNPRWRSAKLGSQRRTQAELELRDRYMALSRHVKLHGIKANPYVDRTLAAFVPGAANTLADAVRRAIRSGGGAA